MTINPYLTELQARSVPKDLPSAVLATAAVAHELRDANRISTHVADNIGSRAADAAEKSVEISSELLNLQEMAMAPPRVVLGSQNPISPEDLHEKMSQAKTVEVPDDSGDARIAAAARRWAEAYVNRNSVGRNTAARLHLAASELAEVIRQEDEG